MKRAFSLVELMMVVALLGILAAMAFPQFQSYTTDAKATTAKANLRVLRSAIELYAARHKGVPPGYPFSNFDQQPLEIHMARQLTLATNENGMANTPGTVGFELGPYMREIPENPFNNSSRVLVILNASDLPENATGNYGWVYKPLTQTIKLDWPGTDSEGIDYYQY